MLSGIVRAGILVAAVSMLSGCAFTQWTDHAFIGSQDSPPTHGDRGWAAAHILPLAIVGDIVTAPIQAIYLAVTHDYSIYSRRNCPEVEGRRRDLCLKGQI